jgi:hypothetical protein
MKVLLDECCPKPLKAALSGMDVSTVEMAGLKGVKNGALLAAADGVFDVLVTADKSLRYQQNLKNRKIAILELPFNSWRRLQSLLPAIQTAVSSIKPGQYLEVSVPPSSP